MRLRTSRWLSFGSASTVCNVETTGFLSRSSSSSRYTPASPPNSPNSCCKADRLELAVVEVIGGVAVVVLAVLSDFERDFGAVAVQVVLIVDGDDAYAFGGLSG
jgi:hypothetical protein